MPLEISSKINIDASPFFAAVKAAVASAKTGAADMTAALSGVTVGALNTAEVSEQFTGLRNAAQKAVSEQRNALAALVATGQDGTDAFRQIKEQLTASIAEARKLDAALETVDNDITGLGEKKPAAGGLLDSIFGGLGTGLGIAAVNGIFGGIKAAFTGLVDAFDTADTTLTNLENGFRLAGLAGEELTAAMENSEKYARSLGTELGQPIDKIKNLSAQAAALGGATGQTNQDLTKLAVGIEAATQGAVSGESAIALFTRGLADPENAAALDKITKKFPALGEEIKKAGSAPEKLQAGLQALSGTFTTLQNDSTDVFARLGTLREQAGQIGQAFSSELFGAVDLSVFKDIFSGLNLEDLIASAKDFGKSLGATLQSIVVAGKNVVEFFVNNGEIIKNVLIGIGVSAAIVGGVMLAQMLPALAATSAAWIAEGIAAAAAWAATLGPITLVIAGLAVVGAGVGYLYTQFAGVREVIDAAFDVAINIGKQALSVIVEYGEAIYAAGKLVLTWLVLPFKVGYAAVQPFLGIIGDVISFFLGFGNSAKGAGGAMATLTKAFDAVKAGIQGIKGFIEGISAALDTVAGTVTKVVEAAKSLDFGGIFDAFSKSGKEAGAAFTDGFNDSIAQDKFDNAVEKADKALAEGLTIRTKVEDILNIGELQSTLADTEAKLKPLEIKAKAGTLTDAEKKTFDELAKKAAEFSNKIKTSAPEAVAGMRTIVSSTGELTTVYSINNAKVDEFATKNKAAFGNELLAKQKQYSDNILQASANLEAQKKRLDEIKVKLDAANAKGDTGAAAKLSDEFNKLQGQIAENTAKTKKGFEDGAKAGLLTAAAAEKIGTSLGLAKGEAAGVVEQLKKQADEAKKVVVDIAAIGTAFADAGKKAGEAMDAAQTQGAGADLAIQQLKKGLTTVEEINTKFKTSFTDQKTALEGLGSIQKQQAADAKKNFGEKLALDKLAAKNNVAAQIEEATKVAKNAEEKTKLAIAKREEAETAAAKKRLTDAAALEIELVRIKAQADSDRLAAEQKTQAAVLAAKKKTAVSNADVQAEVINAQELANKQTQITADANEKIKAIEGKALVARFEQQRKFFEERAAAEVEAAQTTVKLIEEQQVSSTAGELARLQQLSGAKIDLIAAEGRKEIEAAISKNEAVAKADEALKAAFAANNAEMIAAGIAALAEARATAGNSDEVVAIGAKTNKAIIAQNAEAQAAIKLATLQGIEDAAIRTREIALFENEKTLAAQVAAAKGNKQKEIAAYIDAEKQKAEIARQYAAATASTTSKILAAATDAIKSIKFNFSSDTEGAKRAADGIERIGGEIKALDNDLNEGKLSYEDYVQKIAELEEQRAGLYSEKRAAETINFSKGITDGLIAAAQQLADSTARLAQEGADKVIAAQQLAAQTEISIAEEKAKQHKAILEGRVKDAEDAAAKLAELEGVKTKATQDAADTTIQTYNAVGAAAAVSFATMIADGQSAQKAFIVTALQGLQALVPIFVAEIFGKELASKSFAGIATAAALTALLQGLVSAAKSSSGLATGGKTNTAGRIPIPGVGSLIKIDELAPEFVVNHRATMLNEDALTEINRRNITVEQYATEQMIKGAMPISAAMKTALFAGYEARAHDKAMLMPPVQQVNMTTNNYRAAGGGFDLTPITDRLASLENTIVETRQNISVKTKTEVGGELKFDGRDFHAAVEAGRRKALF